MRARNFCPAVINNGPMSFLAHTPNGNIAASWLNAEVTVQRIFVEPSSMEPNLEFPNLVFNPIQKSCIMQVALLQENEVHQKKFFLAPKEGEMQSDSKNVGTCFGLRFEWAAIHSSCTSCPLPSPPSPLPPPLTCTTT